MGGNLEEEVQLIKTNAPYVIESNYVHALKRERPCWCDQLGRRKDCKIVFKPPSQLASAASESSEASLHQSPPLLCFSPGGAPPECARSSRGDAPLLVHTDAVGTIGGRERP